MKRNKNIGRLAAFMFVSLSLSCTDTPTDFKAEVHHFTGYAKTTLFHSLKITNFNLEDAPVTSDWEIGVFTPAGILSGAGIWHPGDTLEILVWGATESIPQFRANEVMTLKGWDVQSDQERLIDYTSMSGGIKWIVNGQSTIKVDAFPMKTTNVHFDSGWNLVSINVDPLKSMWNENGPDIRLMMAQFKEDSVHNVVLMKNERGNFYAPANRDFCNIPFWSTSEGYQVRMKHYVTGRWQGRLIPAETPVPVAAGWNMIAYYPTYPTTCSRNTFNAIASISNYAVLAKDGMGRFASIRNNFSNMEPWEAGRGYQINSSSSVYLQYPGHDDQVRGGTDSRWSIGPWTEPTMTGSNMSVLITGINGVVLNPNDGVAAFSTNGRLVGVGKVTDGMIGLAVWGDDISTESVDGLVTGEAFQLKYYSAVRDTVLDLRMEGGFYQTDGLVASSATISVMP